MVEVLIATMNRKNVDFLKKMNVKSNVLIGNQCDKYDYIEFNTPVVGKMYSFAERGVGLNRNNTLMRATENICLIADDDIIYDDNYEHTIEKAFARHPDADLIIFNVHESTPKRYVNKKDYKVNYLNFMRFGAVRIAFKRQSIHLNGIHFNLCFGGGTKHSNGEDTLFLKECLNHGLKIYAVPEYIATLDESSESTWFNGYNDKYLADKGILYKVMFKKYWKILSALDALKFHKKYNLSSYNAYKKMTRGNNCD